MAPRPGDPSGRLPRSAAPYAPCRKNVVSLLLHRPRGRRAAASAPAGRQLGAAASRRLLSAGVMPRDSWEQKRARVGAVAVRLEHVLAELGLAESARKVGHVTCDPYSSRSGAAPKVLAPIRLS
jgi:hypothetical protein